MRRAALVGLLLAVLLIPVELFAQESEQNIDSKLLNMFEYRMIGPSRGGRSSSVTGIHSDPHTFYMGTSGGGVWKTTDAGQTWNNISDEYFDCGSIGAIAVAPGDENVIYVGTGETNPRGDIQTGLGLYKSTDAGKTWKKLPLIDSGNIGRIRVHPRNENLVYVAVLGHLFGPNEERGVYRSKDGGETWDKVLHVSENTGAVDIAMSPANPRILFAGMWQYVRQPWTQISGGEESGLYRSVDGGDTWEEITDGIPEGIKGKIGVTVSAADPDRVWATIEAEEGGIFFSNDAGETFTRINSERKLRLRPFYYSTIYADPLDKNTVYICSVQLHRSIDGGRTWSTVSVPHGDTHDLWISPYDNELLINANDGGACISFNGGESWSTQMNQPTSEFYRVETDNQFDYRVYGAQQDNSTISVNSQSRWQVWNVPDMYAVGGGEQGHIKVDPRDSNIVYAGNYDGTLTIYRHDLGRSFNIKVWPQMGVGLPAKDYKYRFQMNAPIAINPHNPDIIYHCSQFVHMSADQGKTWKTISPDLTRDDESKQEDPGGPITFDKAGGPENYCTIFAFAHSPLQEGLLWAGSDDGLVHISKNDGESWQKITPPDMPEWATVNEIELSPHDAGRAFLAVQRYRLDDFKPYIFVTNDYGENWKLISKDNGIPENHFVRVVREEPEQKGVLYAGTEFGMYISINDGESWQEFQMNLPRVQVADIKRHENDLVVATHGRSFWILDDVNLVSKLASAGTENTHLVQPNDGYLGRPVPIRYYLSKLPEESLELVISDSRGNALRKHSIKKEQFKKMETGEQSWNWNLLFDAAEVDESFQLWGFNAGPLAIPGEYSVTLNIDGESLSKTFALKPDPRFETTPEQYAAQQKMMFDIREDIESLWDTVNTARAIKSQVNAKLGALEGYEQKDTIESAGKSLTQKLGDLENELIQTKLQASQDILNYPPRLYHQLVTLLNYVMSSDRGPLESAGKRYAELKSELRRHQQTFEMIKTDDLSAFNDMLADMPAILLPKEKE